MSEASASVSRYGPFHVSTGRQEVEAFRRETGWPDAGDGELLELIVPHTFPMSWLGLPEMHAAIEAQLKIAGGVAIHESQTFAYHDQLVADRDYLMDAEIDLQDNPKRLILRASISNKEQQPLLTMETILRLVTAADKAG